MGILCTYFSSGSRNWVGEAEKQTAPFGGHLYYDMTYLTGLEGKGIPLGSNPLDPLPYLNTF